MPPKQSNKSKNNKIKIEVSQKQQQQPRRNAKKAPRKNPKPKPMRRNGSGVHPMALYSPFHNRGHVPTSHPHSEFVPIDSMISSAYNHTAGFEYIYLLTWTPTAYLLTAFYNKADGSLDPVGGHVFAGQQLGATAGAQPLSIKPMRLGLRLQNVTSQLNKAGIVYACPVTSPFPITFGADSGANNWISITLATFNGMKGFVINNRHTQEIPATEIHKRTFVCVPNNEVDYERFYDFSEGDVPTNNDNVIWQAAYSTIQSSTPMSQWLIYVPEAGAQNYVYTIRRTDGCKYPIQSALQNTATKPPRIGVETHKTLVAAANAAIHDPEASKHEGWGTRLLHAGEDSLARLGTGLIHGAEYIGGKLFAKGGAKVLERLGLSAAEGALVAL